MRLASVVFAVFALLLLGAVSASAGPFDYLCHDRGDGAYDHIHVDTMAEAEAHTGHAGDIIPELYYGDDTIYAQNFGEEQEGIWSMSCAVPVVVTPPPAPTEVVDPYGDGEDENGLIPDEEDPDSEPVAVSDPLTYTDPETGETRELTTAVYVSQLPDTGVGSYVSEQSGFFLGAIIAMAGFLMGLWASTWGRRY